MPALPHALRGRKMPVAIAAALSAIGYTGYASAEVFPWPDPDQAAKLTIDAFRRVLPHD